MAAMSNLPDDLIGNILSRVPLTSLKSMRLTCKKWNALSKHQIFGKARTQFPGLMTIGSRVFSMDLNPQGIRKDTNPTIKQVSKLDQVEISSVFHCDGLLLCVTKDENRRLVVCNPYLGQTKWIEPINGFKTSDMFVLGYDKNRCNHKVLRLFDYKYGKGYTRHELYGFKSNTWKVLDLSSDWDRYLSAGGVSLKGNTYFLAPKGGRRDSLICFDFTSEKFGQTLSLPFHSRSDLTGNMTVLSCVKLRDDQLAVLNQRTTSYRVYDPYLTCGMMEIWITTKIEPNDVSWSKFLKFDITQQNLFPNGFVDHFKSTSFFVDEEKSMVVVSGKAGFSDRDDDCECPKACIIREDGYFEAGIILCKALQPHIYEYTVFSSYVPSLVQL